MKVSMAISWHCHGTDMGAPCGMGLTWEPHVAWDYHDHAVVMPWDYRGTAMGPHGNS